MAYILSRITNHIRLKLTRQGCCLLCLVSTLRLERLAQRFQELLVKGLEIRLQARFVPVRRRVAIPSILIVARILLIVFVQLFHKLAERRHNEWIEISDSLGRKWHTDASRLWMDAKGTLEQVIAVRGHIDIKSRVRMKKDGLVFPVLNATAFRARHALV